MDRFNGRPFTSRYDPDSKNPLHIEVVYKCDICEEDHGVFEAPNKCKIKFCRRCKKEVMQDFELTEEDVNHI